MRTFTNGMPESFLEAVRSWRRNPVVFNMPDGVGGGPGTSSGTDTGDAESGDTGAEGAGNDDATDDSGAEEDDADDSKGDEGLPDNVKAILHKERLAARRAKQEAKQAKQEAAAERAKAKEYEDRDKSELEKATERADTAEKALSAADERNKVLALRTAFFSNASVTWHDPEDALELALNKYGLRELEVSDTGTVDAKALKAIVKTLSSEKKYLVKSDDSDKDKGAEKSGARGASGGSFNGGKGGKTDAKSDSTLARRYPAMADRRRVT